MAQIHLPLVEAYAATLRDRERLVVKGIRQLFQAAIDARGAAVPVGTFMPSIVDVRLAFHHPSFLVQWGYLGASPLRTVSEEDDG